MGERTAILTGVTGGWGRAVLDRFLAQGWNVCATSRGGDGDGLPKQALVVAAELTDPASAEQVVAVKRWKRIITSVAIEEMTQLRLLALNLGVTDPASQKR